MKHKQLLPEALVDLRRRLSTLPPRTQERRQVLRETAQLYGVSEDTLYRALRERFRPRSLRRADHGQPRAIPRDELERYCELIAALKLRTSNGKGRLCPPGKRSGCWNSMGWTPRKAMCRHPRRA